jgi:hypothetical protein
LIFEVAGYVDVETKLVVPLVIRLVKHPRPVTTVNGFEIEDAALSRLKHGFESRRERQSFQALNRTTPRECPTNVQ